MEKVCTCAKYTSYFLFCLQREVQLVVLFHCIGQRDVVLQNLMLLRTMWKTAHILKCVSNPIQLTALFTRQPCSCTLLAIMAPLTMRTCPCVSHSVCKRMFHEHTARLSCAVYLVGALPYSILYVYYRPHQVKE